jgi:hypothetical protein
MQPASRSAGNAAAAQAHTDFQPKLRLIIPCSTIVPFISNLRSDGMALNDRPAFHRLAKNRLRRKRYSADRAGGELGCSKGILHFHEEILH